VHCCNPGYLRTGRAPFNASRLKPPKGPRKDPVLKRQDLHSTDVAPHFLPEGASASLALWSEFGAGRRSPSLGAVIQHSLTKGLTARSRDGIPDGSLPAFAWDNVACLRRRNPYPTDYRLAFACSIFLCPQSRRLALRLAFPEGGLRGCHVPYAYQEWGRSRLFAGGATSAAGDL